MAARLAASSWERRGCTLGRSTWLGTCSCLPLHTCKTYQLFVAFCLELFLLVLTAEGNPDAFYWKTCNVSLLFQKAPVPWDYCFTVFTLLWDRRILNKLCWICKLFFHHLKFKKKKKLKYPEIISCPFPPVFDKSPLSILFSIFACLRITVISKL